MTSILSHTLLQITFMSLGYNHSYFYNLGVSKYQQISTADYDGISFLRML